LRDFAGELARSLPNGRFLEGIARALTDERLQVRKLAVQHLSGVGSQALLRELNVVGPLIDLSRDGDVAVRNAAVTALGKTGDRNALDALLEALDDLDDQVRTSAAWALGSLTIYDGRVVKRLIEALQTWRGSARVPALTAARALGMLGDADAVPALLSVSMSEPRDTLWLDCLTSLLEKCAEKVDVQDLRRIAALEDIIWFEETDIENFYRIEEVTFEKRVSLSEA
jgi:HEAT repeat protein